jgi:adenosylhomocysteinase
MGMINNNSMIRDIKLAPQGKIKLDWVKAHMPLLNNIEEQFRDTSLKSYKQVEGR